MSLTQIEAAVLWLQATREALHKKFTSNGDLL